MQSCWGNKKNVLEFYLTAGGGADGGLEGFCCCCFLRRLRRVTFLTVNDIRSAFSVGLNDFSSAGEDSEVRPPFGSPTGLDLGSEGVIVSPRKCALR